jgi:hypothetical protein
VLFNSAANYQDYVLSVIGEGVWGIGRIILAGENQITQKKNLSQCHFTHHKSYMDWDLSLTAAVRGRQLTT